MKKKNTSTRPKGPFQRYLANAPATMGRGKAFVRSTGLVTKAWPVFTRALEDGIRCGLQRSHKHTDNPSDEDIERSIYDAVVSEICEVFDFPDEVDT